MKKKKSYYKPGVYVGAALTEENRKKLEELRGYMPVNQYLNVLIDKTGLVCPKVQRFVGKIYYADETFYKVISEFADGICDLCVIPTIYDNGYMVPDTSKKAETKNLFLFDLNGNGPFYNLGDDDEYLSINEWDGKPIPYHS
jgi:hypothetical protein